MDFLTGKETILFNSHFEEKILNEMSEYDSITYTRIQDEIDNEIESIEEELENVDDVLKDLIKLSLAKVDKSELAYYYYSLLMDEW